MTMKMSNADLLDRINEMMEGSPIHLTFDEIVAGIGSYKQARRATALLQDASQNKCYWVGRCWDEGKAHDAHRGQFVYELTNDPEKGELYALRREGQAAKMNRAAVKALRQARANTKDPQQREQLRQSINALVKAQHNLIPALSGQAAKHGYTPLRIDRMMERLELDALDN